MTHIIYEEALESAPPEAIAMANAITKGNPAVLGCLFYGSGLWKTIEHDTVLDFYVIVDSYKNYGAPLSHCFWGTWLPPNVYYTEKTLNGEIIRCKYAVITWAQFYRSARGFSIAPSIFARFSQPCRLLCAKNDTAQEKIIKALYEANTTFHRRTLRLLAKRKISPAEIWQVGLAETYKSELRSEKKGRNTSIFTAAPESFLGRTALFSQNHPNLLKHMGAQAYENCTPSWQRYCAFFLSPFRRYGGKLVTLLRLIKAPLTFEGSVDYIVWKIERHTGEKLTPTNFQRRHPLVAGWPLLYKALKNKVVK